MSQEIYVKEMPKSCLGCKFFAKHRRQCEIELGFEWNEERQKYNDCPLKSLHDHDKELVEKLDQQKAMWNELKEWLEYRIGENGIFGNDEQCMEDDLILDKMQELEKELAELKEKDNYHLRYELAGADEIITKLKKQLEEKDKEIEEKMMSFEKRCQEYYKSDEFKRDFAIQELEEVEKACFNQKELVDFGNVACFMVDIADILEIINDKIKELKGE